MKTIYLVSEIGGQIQFATDNKELADQQAVDLSAIHESTFEVLECEFIN
jgi:tRNA G46 methylase TrmB